MRPFAHANTIIGSARNVLSINGGSRGKMSRTYIGSVGNPMNLINIIIAGNEEDFPFAPLSVRNGYEKEHNIITLVTGYGNTNALFPCVFI
jgi:hypothetical protein